MTGPALADTYVRCTLHAGPASDVADTFLQLYHVKCQAQRRLTVSTPPVKPPQGTCSKRQPLRTYCRVADEGTCTRLEWRERHVKPSSTGQAECSLPGADNGAMETCSYACWLVSQKYSFRYEIHTQTITCPNVTHTTLHHTLPHSLRHTQVCMHCSPGQCAQSRPRSAGEVMKDECVQRPAGLLPLLPSCKHHHHLYTVDAKQGEGKWQHVRCCSECHAFQKHSAATLEDSRGGGQIRLNVSVRVRVRS